MTWIEWIKIALTGIFIGLAVISDYKEYKIKNISVVAFLIAGLLFNLITAGTPGLYDSILGLLIPLILLPLFALRMLGAGDIKAFCAIGSIVGLKMNAFILLYSFLVGGILALGFMILRKNALERFKKLGSYLYRCLIEKKLLSYDSFTDEKSKFRFSLGIFGGFICTFIIRLAS